MPQIRLNKTPEIADALAFLQRKYKLLSEAEIIKVALAEKYNKEKQGDEEPNDYLLEMLKQSEEDIKKGNVSPGFTNAKDAVTWLNQP